MSVHEDTSLYCSIVVWELCWLRFGPGTSIVTGDSLVDVLCSPVSEEGNQILVVWCRSEDAGLNQIIRVLNVRLFPLKAI